MVEAHFENIRFTILNQIENASEHLHIAVAWFTNEDLFKALLNSLERGVVVELIIIDDYINNGEYGLPFQQFIDKGGRLYYGLPDYPMHHKFCIVDKNLLITGSYNWTYYAESINDENILLVQERPVIDDYVKEFQSLVSRLNQVDVHEKRSEEIDEFLETPVRMMYATDIRLKGLQKHDSKLIAFAEKINKNRSLPEPKTPSSKTPNRPRIISTSVGIEVHKDGVGDIFNKMIVSGTEVPTKVTKHFGVNTDNQETATVKIFIGENNKCSENKFLSEFKLSIKPELKSNSQTKLSCSFEIFENGILKVTAKDKTSGNLISMEYFVTDQLT